MNKTFDWSRFGKLVRKDFSNIWQNAGTSLLIITLLPLAVWLFWWALSGVKDVPAILPEVRWGFIACVVSLAVIVTPSRMYRFEVGEVFEHVALHDRDMPVAMLRR